MNAVCVVLLATVLRLIFANFTGLGIDESYMVASSDHFSVSYFDHPLASWWLELGSRALFHSMAPIIVRLPFILLSAVSSWLIYRITARLYTRGAAFWAVVAYNISPVFSLAFGSWVLPDGPVDAALLAALYAMLRALGIAAIPTPPQPRWWLAAGFFAGMAMLSKYNAALVLAGAGMAMLSDPVSRRELRRFAPWGAAALAVAMFMPVIWWNAQHGWQSFNYQGGRAAGLRLHPLAPLTIWGGEALFLLPWLWLPMVCLQIGALWRGPAERRGWLLSLLGLLPVMLFSVVGIWSSTKILYHWATPGYLMLLPMVGNWAEHFRPRLRNVMAALSGGLLAFAALFIAAEATLNFIPGLNRFFPPSKSPLLQIIDWDTAALRIPRDAQVVAALRWYDAGKIAYALRDRLPVTVFGTDPHEFGITTPASSLLHKNVLILAMPGNVSQIADEYAPDFMLLQPGPALTVMHGHDVLLVIPTLLGTDLRHVPGT
jgi:4-amino-4-deoxy-L-arabinose transferase-like glycosyltransferase